MTENEKKTKDRTPVAVTHTNLVMPGEILPDTTLILRDGVIEAFGKDLPTDGMRIVDGSGLYTGPGLIEVHTHSDGDVFFTEDPESVSRKLLEHGVTTALAALYFNMDRENLIAAIRKIRGVMEAGKAPNLFGFYMEAPYLNPKFGCDKTNNPWAGAIRREDYLPLIREAGKDARVWCVAPEREGIEEFVKDALKENPKTVFSVAHSEANNEQIERLMPYGLKIATHCTNATGGVPRYPECRPVGVDETAWYYDDVYTELICDSVGIHVNPFLLRLITKIKGRERIILISDSFVEHGPVPEGYEGVEDINFDFEGEIAGTKMTLDVPCRNIMKHTGCSIADAFLYASTNPARALGLDDRGQIAVGKRADVVTVDKGFHVRHLILGGEIVK